MSNIWCISAFSHKSLLWWVLRTVFAISFELGGNNFVWIRNRHSKSLQTFVIFLSLREWTLWEIQQVHRCPPLASRVALHSPLIFVGKGKWDFFDGKQLRTTNGAHKSAIWETDVFLSLSDLILSSRSTGCHAQSQIPSTEPGLYRISRIARMMGLSCLASGTLSLCSRIQSCERHHYYEQACNYWHSKKNYFSAFGCICRSTFKGAFWAVSWRARMYVSGGDATFRH